MPEVCRWTNQKQALEAFAGFTGKTESAGQIKPLHWYVACRLVLEGGFDPDDITPRPPFRVQRRGKRVILHYDESLAEGGEQTVLGGLKTKKVDVVVTRKGIGPVLAVSCKGVTVSFRNLTNRMEETIGECTNLHITYPALVLGYLVVLRANRLADEMLEEALEDAAEAEALDEDDEPGRALTANDIAMTAGGEPIAGIMRFHNALRELVGRRGIRDDVSRYEAIGLGMVEMEPSAKGSLLDTYPPADSVLHLERFFDTLYLRHDERFVTSAPDLAGRTRRLEWDAESPALAMDGVDYPIRSTSD